MKIFRATAFPEVENWDGHKGKLKQLFTLLTGYDIMSEESRKDEKPVTLQRKSGFSFGQNTGR